MMRNRIDSCIIYCHGAGTVESKAKEIAQINTFTHQQTKDLLDLIKHIKTNFHHAWVVVQSLENGIGILFFNPPSETFKTNYTNSTFKKSTLSNS